MKRALAERAKQSFETINAKPPTAANIQKAPQHPDSQSPLEKPSVNHSSNKIPIHDQVKNSEIGAGYSTVRTNQSKNGSGTGTGTGLPAYSVGITGSEPPNKVQRIENPSTVPSLTNYHNSDSSVSPVNSCEQNVLVRVNNSTFQPPNKRILPENPHSAPEPVSKGSKKRREDDDTQESEVDSSSSFYLKHQNRALVTELKSLQFEIRQLEEERDARRQHCLAALRAIHELQNIWTCMEQNTVVGGGTTISNAAIDVEASDPPSTGTGDSVEWTRALHNALVALGQDTSDNNDTMSTNLLEHASVNITARAKVLQEWLGTLLQSTGRDRQPQENEDSLRENVNDLRLEMSVIRVKCSELEAQVLELATSRQQVISRERRVRRNVYRMAAGILSPDQVVKTLDRGEGNELETEVQLEKQELAVKSELVVESLANDSQEQKTLDTMTLAQLEEYKCKTTTLEETLGKAEDSIQELNSLISEKERRITELSKNQLSETNATKLESLESTLIDLKNSQDTVTSLQTKLVRIEKAWSQSIGNETAMLTAMDELIGKFNKRWAELSRNDQSGKLEIPMNKSQECSDDKIVAAKPDDPFTFQAKHIAELQHKLDQALENVRQAETAREYFKEALALNTTLQSKLDEAKSKYAAAQAARSASSGNNKSMNNSSSSSRPVSNSKDISDAAAAAPKDKEVASSEHKLEKIHRDFKKARKDLANMAASREAAKAKLERSEKERESLVESNVRLLRQIGEKDEMNAKSLSTILHLKSMTEKLMAERDNLEQQSKTASQLALAARLATNAKERVSEEISNDKKLLEDRVNELEKVHEATLLELNRISSDYSQANAKMTVKESELSNAMKRCDELVSENEQKREEIRKLVDVVSRVEREKNEAKSRLSNAIQSGTINGGINDGGTSGSFTVDQLKTQISVLKGRLSCPVCHYRDKECIILRCRHMHCKQCVDERISNRSRKCPTCNVKFSENDIGDVWL